MMTISGRLERVDLGGGAWSLITEGGGRYTLVGDVPDRLAGQQVEVRGSEEQGMGFAMTGDPMLMVAAIRPISG